MVELKSSKEMIFLRNKLNERSNLIKPDKPMDKQAARFLSQINPVARLRVSNK